MCDNYVPQWWAELDNELSWSFTKRFRVFILFAGNSQILLKISVILIFIYLVALYMLVNKQPTQLISQLNSSLLHIIVS